MKQVVVWGPPCSGKSTYVLDRMRPGDLRYDLDALDMALTGISTHPIDKDPRLGLLLDFRADFIRATADAPGHGTAYIIATDLTDALTDSLGADAEYIGMDTTLEECLHRLSQDDTRPEKDDWAELIKQWFETHKTIGACAMQYTVCKSVAASAAPVSDADMAAINAQALSTLSPDDVFVFRCAMCNDQPDRDFERFPVETLEGLAKMFVGKPVISDHAWSASRQVARIYRTELSTHDDGSTHLIGHCYMPRNDTTKDMIAAISGGIMREMSVGCAIGRTTCSICGADAMECQHIKGAQYAGGTCIYELRDPLDAYELSFVAVPAQPAAGVTKQNHNQGWTPADMAAAKARLNIEQERWKYT